MRHSRAVIGFWLMHLFPRRDEVAAMIAELLGAVAAGELEVVIGDVYPLSEARRAHEDLAGAPHHGKLLLDPRPHDDVSPSSGLKPEILRSAGRARLHRARRRSRSRRSRSCSPVTT